MTIFVAIASAGEAPEATTASLVPCGSSWPSPHLSRKIELRKCLFVRMRKRLLFKFAMSGNGGTAFVAIGGEP